MAYMYGMANKSDKIEIDDRLIIAAQEYFRGGKATQFIIDYGAEHFNNCKLNCAKCQDSSPVFRFRLFLLDNNLLTARDMWDVYKELFLLAYNLPMLQP